MGGTALDVGGVDKYGRDITNDLSYMALDAHAQTEKMIQNNDAHLTAGMTEAERQEFRRLLKLAAQTMGVAECAPFPQTEKEE